MDISCVNMPVQLLTIWLNRRFDNILFRTFRWHPEQIACSDFRSGLKTGCQRSVNGQIHSRRQFRNADTSATSSRNPFTNKPRRKASGEGISAGLNTVTTSKISTGRKSTLLPALLTRLWWIRQTSKARTTNSMPGPLKAQFWSTHDTFHHISKYL